MEYIYEKKSLIVKDIKCFDLKDTLDCGQCFRFTEDDDHSFTAVVKGKIIKLSFDKKNLVIKGINKKDVDFFLNYFDLLTDYKKINDKLKKTHPVMKEAASFAKGIRILKQEPFETLISFIISQNNNIPRIKGIIDKLCFNFGEKIDDTHYAFPTVEKLSKLKLKDLDVIKAGFRNKYILDAVEKVKSGEINLSSIYDMSYDEGLEYLMRIKGVGKKVADCVLLYSYHKLESFPLDVWMKRAMNVLFDDMGPKVFGNYGGIAQQYIFHYSRMHKELFD